MCRLTDIEIEILIRKNEALKDEVCELRTEIERLKPFEKKVLVSVLENIKQLEYEKAEAVKEFAERLKNLTASYWLDNLNVGHINDLVKEMTENEGKE